MAFQFIMKRIFGSQQQIHTMQSYVRNFRFTSCVNNSFFYHNQRKISNYVPSTPFSTYRLLLNKVKIGHNAADALKDTPATLSSLRGIKTEALKAANRYTFKQLWKQYGVAFAIWYSLLYFGGMAFVYVIIESGVLGSNLNVLEWLETTPIANHYDLASVNPIFGNLVGAVLINEVLGCVRLPVALVTVSHIKRLWDRRRLTKNSLPPPS